MPESAVGEEPPEFPYGMEYLWGYFLEISFPVSSNGFAPLPLSFLEIAAWARLMNHRLTPWEVQILRELSATYLRVFAEEQKKKQPPETPNP